MDNCPLSRRSEKYEVKTYGEKGIIIRVSYPPKPCHANQQLSMFIAIMQLNMFIFIGTLEKETRRRLW